MKLDVIKGKANKICFDKFIQVKLRLLTLGVRMVIQCAFLIKNSISPTSALNYIHPTY